MARDPEHLRCHRPTNPFCPSCIQAKAKRRRRYKGASRTYQESVREWGDLVTADHVTASEDRMLSCDNKRDALFIKDIWSGLRHMYPVTDKSAAETVRCISHFQGRRQIKVLYSDNSGELSASCRALEILPQHSVPGIPQSNAIAERLVQDCLEGRTRPPPGISSLNSLLSSRTSIMRMTNLS